MDPHADEEYLLKWNSHNAELVAEFHELCKDELFTDVTLAAEEETFEAHKLVLSACSPYFKAMFTKTPCKHPVIFLKDVSAQQMAILLKYMYLGQISVKKEELNPILKIADSLRIRGLTTSTTIPEEPALMMTEAKPDVHEDHHQVIQATFASSKPSRKGYLPKRLRTSGDSGLTTGSSPRLDSLSPSTQRDRRTSDESEQNEKGSNVTPIPEEDEDQPVDFSQNRSSPDKPRYSILSNYLKTGKIGSMAKTGIDTDDASISKAAESLAASWLEQSLTAMQAEEKDRNGNSRTTTLPLRETLGLDIADRLRSHFLSSLPTQTNFSSTWSANNPNATQPNGLTNGHPTNPLSPVSANGKPSVSCEICGKKLADPSSLYRHRKIHSGDKPHKCPYCSRRFIQRYNMKQHIKTHRLERMTEREKAEYLPKSARMPSAAATAPPVV